MGPYNLGGWSAGDVLAYGATLRLLCEGESMEHLILLDSPFPDGFDRLPKRMFDFLERSACFGPAKHPPWLFPHFVAFIESLARCKAPPLPETTTKTSLLWATKGMAMHEGDPRPISKPDEVDTTEMKRFLKGRKDFGGNGWEKLVGGAERLMVEKLEGITHFTMMKGDLARKVAEFLRRAMLE